MKRIFNLKLQLIFTILIIFSGCLSDTGTTVKKIKPKVAAVSILPLAVSYTTQQTITLSCSTQGVTIYYTTDGTAPTTASNLYTNPFNILVTTKISAFAVKSGMTDSDITNTNYTINIVEEMKKVEIPKISPATGSYLTSQAISISCSTSNATIHYTTDGSIPNNSSKVFINPFTVNTTTTVKAIGVKSGMKDSDIVIKKYSFPSVENPKILEVTIPSTITHPKGIIALNVSGDAGFFNQGSQVYEGLYENTGNMPRSTNAISRSIGSVQNDKYKSIKDKKWNTSKMLKRSVAKQSNSINYTTASYNFKIDSGTFVSANKVYGTSTSKCLIFLQNTAAISTDWNSLGSYFDNTIYPKVTNVFGTPSDIDSNGKIIILYFDMGNNEKNTVGYFDSSDLIPGSQNDMEMFYMNAKWGNGIDFADPNGTEMKRTLAHEFQHMINYAQRELKGKTGMDTWINEGLSESSEQIATNVVGASRIETLNEDSQNLIKNGASLCVWGGNVESYALTYTFMQYCKNQVPKKERLFTDIINSEYGDYRAVQNAVTSSTSNFKTFSDLMVGYRIANLVNGDGIYGYGDEKSLFHLSAPAFTAAFNNMLMPGGAVYTFPSESLIDSFTPAGSGGNILFIKVK